jgi:tetratricopeptide (TPR) repeat protein
MTGRLREGQSWIEQALAQAEGPPSPLRLRAMAVLGELYRAGGDFERARSVKEAAMPFLRRTTRRGTAATLRDLGQIALAQGRYEQAGALFDEALAIRRQLTDPLGVAHALQGLAELAVRTGDLVEARSLYEQILAIAREVGDAFTVVDALLGLAEAAFRDGDVARAEDLFRDSLALTARLQEDLSYLINGLTGLAAVAARRDQPLRAARLAGAVDAIRAASGLVLTFQSEHEQRVDEVRLALGEERFSAAWAEGSTMSVEEAVGYALDPEGAGGPEADG